MTLKTPITFSEGCGHLDRASHLRVEARELMAGPDAVLLPLCDGKALIDLSGETPRLGWLEPSEDLLGAAQERPVFLGIADGKPCFAADFTGLEDDETDTLFGEGTKLIDLRSIAGDLNPGSASIIATAKGVLGWHETHRFCSRCGAPSTVEDAGWRRQCTRCGGLHFPRTDPVVIMLILHDDHVLLGRQTVWPEGLYSLLAGFMEPGETIEEAVRRETYEESGIRVSQVRYLACQPWPFPSSLMMGCVGRAEGRALTIDPDELEDAVWISRAKMEVILDGKHPRFASPRRDAIARSILTSWVAGEIEEF